MSELRTDFKDEIFQDGESHRVYNIKRKGTDEVVESGIYLEKAYTPQQEGDEFGAKEVNETHAILNVLSQDNLLINSDFKSGIINQKGQTNYPTNASGDGNKYTIDMWRKQYCLKVDVGSNFITATNTQAVPVTFLQLLNNISGTFTFACDIASITGSPKLCVYDKGAESFKEQALKTGLNVFTFETTNVTGAGIRFYANNDSVKIKFMKLEKGSFFTGMPTWNEKLELLKCQYYFDDKIVTVNTIYDYGGNQYAFHVSWDSMYKKPSVNIISVASYGSDGQYRSASEFNVQQTNDRTASCRCKFAQSLKNPSNQLVVEFTADSNDY